MTRTRFRSFRRSLATLAAGAVFAVAGLLAAAPAADAARGRAIPGESSTAAETTPPATPEPGAAIAFALGLGVVAYAVRRSRSR